MSDQTPTFIEHLIDRDERILKQQALDLAYFEERLTLIENAHAKKFINPLPIQHLWIKTIRRDLVMRLKTLFSNKNIKNSEREKLARLYFKDYFLYVRGVTHYKTSPFPKSPEKPMLILTPRIHPYSSLFAYQLFEFPILTPVDPTIYGYQVLPGNNIPQVGHYLHHSTYRDVSLNTAWPHLKTLLEKGYSVIAHINAGFQDPQMQEKRPVYSVLREVLTDKNLPADLYFLYLDGFHRYPHSTIYSPIQIRCDLRSQNDLMIDDTLSQNEKIEFALRFFNIWDFMWVEK